MIPSKNSEPVLSARGEPVPSKRSVPAEGARKFTLLGTRRFCAEAISLTGCGVLWRDDISPVSSEAQARQVKTAVVGWATAESPAAGCGADHDRMTSLHSRRSLVSRWRRWTRAWGRDEPVTNDPAA